MVHGGGCIAVDAPHRALLIGLIGHHLLCNSGQLQRQSLEKPTKSIKQSEQRMQNRRAKAKRGQGPTLLLVASGGDCAERGAAAAGAGAAGVSAAPVVAAGVSGVGLAAPLALAVEAEDVPLGAGVAWLAADDEEAGWRYMCDKGRFE